MPEISPPIEFIYKINPGLREVSRLKKFILSIFEKEKRKLQTLTYVFCSDSEVLKINLQYLQHDFYTDILTFDLSEVKSAIIGEIYISVDRVKDNSGTYGTSFKQEMLRVIFHGALHLCGYHDKTSTQKALMTQKEEENLLRYKKFHVKH